MKCVNTPFCWACHGSFSIFMSQPIWLTGVDGIAGVSLEKGNRVLKVKSGVIRQPFGKSSFRLIARDDYL